MYVLKLELAVNKIHGPQLYLFLEIFKLVWGDDNAGFVMAENDLCNN